MRCAPSFILRDNHRDIINRGIGATSRHWCLDFLLLELDVLLARTKHISIAGAHRGAEALVPADAHAALVVLFDAAVALVVAILADGDAFKTSQGALEVSLAAELFFLRSALGVGGDDEVLVGELEGFADGAFDGWDGGLGEVEAEFVPWGVATGLEAGVVEEAVGVGLVAEGDLVRASAREEVG